jgi:hypothetical protein
VEVVRGDFGCGAFVVDFVVEERGEFADTDPENHAVTRALPLNMRDTVA